jgi:hypothetical protein
MIAVRPAVEPRHRVEEMLRALDDRWPPRFLSDVYEALDPQKPCTEVLSNSVQQELRFVARKRGLACENEILNSPAFEVGTVGPESRATDEGPTAGLSRRSLETKGVWRLPPATNRPRRYPLTG